MAAEPPGLTVAPREKLPPTGDVDLDARRAHAHCDHHREAVAASDRCGCFYCLAIYAPAEIVEWIDTGAVTARCPRCGIDSVIGSASGYPIERGFLERMHAIWFG